MMGNAEIMLNMANSPEQVELLEDIQACGNQALQRVSDILDYGTFLESGLVFEAQTFPLTPFISNTVAAFGKKHERNITLVIDADCGMPEYVDGDAPKLARVVNNVLDNAVKHTTAADKISVRVGLPSATLLSYLRDVYESTPDLNSLQNQVLPVPLCHIHLHFHFISVTS